MRICQHHWELVIQGVKDRGLWHLVSQDKLEAFANMTAPLEGRESTFDPLLAYNNYVWSKALQVYGLNIMSHNPDDPEGHYCPLCCVKASFDHHNTPTGRCSDPKCTLQVNQGDRAWDIADIENSLDSMLKHCQAKGLTTPAQ